MTFFRSFWNFSNTHRYKYKHTCKVSRVCINCELATIAICQLDLYEGQSIKNENSLIF